MKISVVINTYNSANTLRKCLNAVSNFDEIVICDMYSTDETVAIAKEYTSRIVYHKHTGIVEPARNFAIAAATNEWILVVDSDEVVPGNLKDYLYQFISSPNEYKGLFLTRKNFFMGRFMHSSYPDYILRFFKKGSVEWPVTIHATPIIKGKTKKIPSQKKELALIHLADENISDLIKKMNTYTDKAAEKKIKDYGYIAFTFKSFFPFFKSYILKGGIRDGLPGFIKCGFDSFYKFIVMAKISQQRLKNKSNEKSN
ncbi:MAG: glycosyltransferase family 2 protein [Bacteroidales bacterium]|nr:glycosyltransferase family 2 protein [Bacteroidales bacterium]